MTEKRVGQGNITNHKFLEFRVYETGWTFFAFGLLIRCNRQRAYTEFSIGFSVGLKPENFTGGKVKFGI